MNLANGFSDANASPAVAAGEGCLHGIGDTMGPIARSLLPQAGTGGIGDVNSNARGSGARFNGGKPPMELIPLRTIAQAFLVRPRSGVSDIVDALISVAEFQETGDVRHIHGAMHDLFDYWESCARVFDYGRAKYAEWNWAKGMSWSVPIACIGRHSLKVLRGELRDDESGELHAGHILCNLVMLATFVRTYPEGDDLPPRELFETRAAA